jgi:TPR repeat protein
MDRATLKSLAAGGDLGAIQAYAAGSLPDDPLTAMEYYGQASRLGSVAAMGEIARILTAFGQPGATDPLRPLRDGEPDRDLRPDAVAWTLAAIRQYGPLAVTPDALEKVDDLVVNPNDTAVITTCGRSLAILADLSAAGAGRNSSTLPPVFLAERDLYARLPCGNTPAPVMPPRALQDCAASPAVGGAGQPIELWICEGT